MKLFHLRKCKYCGSIFVTWNWFSYETDPTIKIVGMDEENIYGTYIEFIKQYKWSHECWLCSNVQETNHKVINGIPYKLLCYLFRWSE